MFTIEEVSRYQSEEIKIFLKKFDLEYENDIDYTIAIYDKGKVIATASKAKNLLKCFAILEDYQGQGITNSLVKKIEDRMFMESLYHFFIYTPSCNKDIFTSIGYHEIITSNHISILENGNKTIETYLYELKDKYDLSDNEKACIVMNANPFTLGHRYLVEEASKENDEVIIFVVSENQSSFPFEVRFQLIVEGVRDLKNVYVVETGPYMISNATFPTYFLKKKSDVVTLQTKIDCEIFLKYYHHIFHITKRYIGNEPYCEVTKTYNEWMHALLPLGGVEVKQITRKQVFEDIISASKVRELIKQDDYEQVKNFVPQSTYAFLISDQAKPIVSKLKQEDKRH